MMCFYLGTLPVDNLFRNICPECNEKNLVSLKPDLLCFKVQQKKIG